MATRRSPKGIPSRGTAPQWRAQPWSEPLACVPTFFCNGAVTIRSGFALQPAQKDL